MMGKASLIAFGSYVPVRILTNQDLEKTLDTSDQWIRSRTGIRERRICAEGESTTDIAVAAFQDLMERYPSVSKKDVGAVIFCTATPSVLLAPSATSFAYRVGIRDAFCFDLNAACSGFLYGLSVASDFIKSGRYANVLVVGADKMSSIVDYEDRTTCVIFGDGGGCVLLGRDMEYGIEDFVISGDGSGAENLCCPSGGSKVPVGSPMYKPSDQFVKQDGPYVFKKAVIQMVDVSRQILMKQNLSIEDIDWLLPHQANIRIIDKVALDLGIDRKKVLCNIEYLGNTTHGTIPLLMSDYADHFKRGDKLLLTVFGAGFTWGSLYLTWA